MSEHVVHLAGDPGSFGRLGFGDPSSLLGFTAAGAFQQRGDKRAADLGQRAPGN